MTTLATSFALLMDGAPPAGADVHTLPIRVQWEREQDYRTVAVTRTDGSRWSCRAVLPSRARVPATDKVAPLPDGRRFTTGYYAVDRDTPDRRDWIMAPFDIQWSPARDVVVFFEHDWIAGFGPGANAWTCRLPGADPDGFLLFDSLADGVLRCTAGQSETNQDGEKVYVSYQIEVASGTIKNQWIDWPRPEDEN